MKRITLTFALCALLLMACRSPEGVVVHSAASWVLVPYEQMVTQADTIVVGRITEVGPTRWNQDGGAFWQPGPAEDAANIDYHPVTVAVDEVLAANASVPATQGVALDFIVYYGMQDAPLSVGDEVVLYLEERSIIWRDDTMRPFTVIVGGPTQGAFTLNADGLYERASPEQQTMTLADLITDIERLR